MIIDARKLLISRSLFFTDSRVRLVLSSRSVSLRRGSARCEVERRGANPRQSVQTTGDLAQFSERDRFKCDRHFFQAVLPFAVYGRPLRLRRTPSKRLPDGNDSQLARRSPHGDARRRWVSRMLISTCH